MNGVKADFERSRSAHESLNRAKQILFKLSDTCFICPEMSSVMLAQECIKKLDALVEKFMKQAFWAFLRE